MFRRVTAILLLALVLLCQPMDLVRASPVTVRSEKDVVVVLWDPPKPLSLLLHQAQVRQSLPC